jgi:predicted Zn-dependent protease
MARLRTLLLLLLLGSGAALLLSPGFMRDPVTGRRIFGLHNPSVEEEIRQGREAAAALVAAHDGAYPDPRVAAHLQEIVRRLGAASHRPRLPYRFTLLNSSAPNAFALPGGEVFLTRGLLVRLEEEARFAVVMGHEIGHVNHRHSVQALNEALLVELGAGVVAGSVEDERRRRLAEGIAGFGAGLLLLRFSREQEIEADDRGIEYAHRAGWDPRRGEEVFRGFARARREAAGAPGALDAWLSSHPLDGERVEHLREEVERRWPALRGGAPARDLVVSTPAWDALLAGVRAAHPLYERLDRARAAGARAIERGDRTAALRAAREAADAGRALPGHALFPAVEGAILLAAGERRAAREPLTRAATLQPGLLLARLRLADLGNEEGRFAEAAAEARTACALVPGAAAPLLVLGRALEGLRRTGEAAAAYAEAARLAASGSAEERGAVARLRALERGGR